MYSSDEQSEMKHGTPRDRFCNKADDPQQHRHLSHHTDYSDKGRPLYYEKLLPLPQSDDAGGYPNEYELGKQTLIAETENLKIEELEIELSQLKWCCLYKLQQSLNQQNFPSAIAYIDSLAQRLPDAPDVRQWQAIAYLRWGRQLRKEKDIKKAECCFNKALSVLPKNSSLHSEIQSELSRLCEFF